MSILIKKLPDTQKPREKFKRVGVQNLSNEDLIAIILRTGTKDLSVKDLAINISSFLGNLKDYNLLTIKSLCNIKGIGEVKAITLLSAIELGRRTITQNNFQKLTVLSPEIIYNLFKYNMLNEDQEHLIAVFLDSKKNIIATKEIFKGTTNTIITHQREVYKEAIKHCAVSIILVHNHPSGNPKPSKEDILFTQKIIEVGKFIEIPLIDHIIIGNNSYYSFYEEGMVK